MTPASLSPSLWYPTPMSPALLEPPARSTPGLNPWPDVLYSLRMSWGEDGIPVTQEEAARISFVHERSWRHWENGERLPSAKVQLLFHLILKNPAAILEFSPIPLDAADLSD